MMVTEKIVHSIARHVVALAIVLFLAPCFIAGAHARSPFRIKAVTAAVSDYMVVDSLTGFIAAHLQTDVDNARAVLESARGQLPSAQATFERQQALMSSGFTTRAAFDQAEEGLRAAEAAVASAEALLGVAKEQLSYTV